MYLSMIIILTHFHLLLAESILRTRELLKCYFYQFEECSPRGDIRIEITVLPRSIGPRFIANLPYCQNFHLSRFHPLKIPRYTAKLSYHHPSQVFRHKSHKINLNSPVSTAHNYLFTAVY